MSYFYYKVLLISKKNYIFNIYSNNHVLHVKHCNRLVDLALHTELVLQK